MPHSGDWKYGIFENDLGRNLKRCSNSVHRTLLIFPFAVTKLPDLPEDFCLVEAYTNDRARTDVGASPLPAAAPEARTNYEV